MTRAELKIGKLYRVMQDKFVDIIRERDAAPVPGRSLGDVSFLKSGVVFIYLGHKELNFKTEFQHEILVRDKVWLTTAFSLYAIERVGNKQGGSNTTSAR